MTNATRYPDIEVSGTPFEMGCQIGEAAREEIRGFSEVALERLNKTVPVSFAVAISVARDCFSFVQEYSPYLLKELYGMAASSGVSVERLMLLQVRNQLQAEAEAGCTSFSTTVSQTSGSETIVAQNWDNDPLLDSFTIMLTRKPEGKPAFMSLTQAGLIAYIGVSENAVGVCLNTLPAPSRRVGVPHYFLIRKFFECATLAECVDAVDRTERAIPANVMLATPQGPANLEITVDEVRVLEKNKSGMVTHSNHCVHPDLTAINGKFPELIDSHARKRRIDAMFANAPMPRSVERMQEFLRDHDNHPRSICRHANDHPEHGFWTTVFSVVIEAGAGRIHASRGNPCEQPYEVYELG